MILFCVGFLFFGLAGSAHAATYYVRADGTAANVAAAIGPSSDVSKTMNVTVFNSSTFSDDDVINFSSRGGNFTAGIIIPSGGSSQDHKVTYQGESGYIPTFNGGDSVETLVDVVSKNNLEIKDMVLTHPTVDGLNIRGTSNGVIIRNIVSTYSGNQSFQLRNTASATYYDIQGDNSVDDGFSMHDATVAVIHGGIFNNNDQGINIISQANLTADNITALDNITYSLYVTQGTTVSASITNFIANSRIRTDAGNTTISRGTIYYSGTDGHVIDTQPGATSGNVNIYSSVIYNMGLVKFAVAVRSGSTVSILNSNIIDASDKNGKGIFTTTGGVLTLKNSNLTEMSVALHDGGTASKTLSHNNIWGNVGANVGTWTDASSVAVNPIYTSTSTPNFVLNYLSPAIDAGTDVGLTTDYVGNSIYGTPDIGAYEYQPPYTIGTNEMDVSAEARVYADGKFRNIGTAGGTTADLTITPNSGSFTSDTSAWMDITDMTWNTTGDYSKQWTESSTFSGLTNTVHTIGDLEANKYYNVTVDSSTTNLSGTNCNTAGSSYTCLSNSSGEITFTYLGTYSTHTFDVTEGDNTVPAISGVTSVPTSTGATITWTTDEASSSLVEYGLTSSYGTSTSEADTGTRVVSHSVLLSNLSTCTRYYYRVHSKDATTNESIVVGNSFLTTECGGGGLPVGAYAPPTSPTGGFKVSINNNTETTNSPNVTLSLTAGTDTKNMAISNLPDFQNTTQEPYQPTKQWDLCWQRTTCPAGQYTVYVKFYTQYGQTSETVSASINVILAKAGIQSTNLDSLFQGNDGGKSVLIAQIRQQLISLITQLIQMLYLEVEQMRK